MKEGLNKAEDKYGKKHYRALDGALFKSGAQFASKGYTFKCTLIILDT